MASTATKTTPGEMAGQEGYASEALFNLQKVYAHLGAAEKRVADYVLASPGEVIYCTVTELAERTQTSESTVVRLAQRAGYEGYQALKIALARDVAGPNPSPFIYEDVERTDALPALKQKVFTTNILALSKTLESLDDGELARAVDALAAARRIELYGLGGSAAVAFDAYHKFLKIGIPAVAVLDSNMQVMSAAQLTRDDVAVGISHSGTLKDTIEVMQAAAAAGAATICITNHAKSPLAKACSIRLITATHGSAFQTEIMASRIAQLSIIDTLYVAIALRRYDAAQATLRRTSQATVTRRY